MQVDRDEAGDLMDRASANEDGAFGCLAEAMQDGLYRFAVAQGLSGPDAADAVQETLLRAFRGRGRWRRGGDAVGWLYGIAMNVVREFRRKAKRYGRLAPIGPDVLAGPGPNDDETGVDLARLGRAMTALPDRQREAVACRFLRRLSVRETAAAMGCAEGTVKAAVHAALENLRKQLGEEP